MDELDKIIKEIINNAVDLKDKYTEEKSVPVDWVCVFSQNQDELKEFNRQAKLIGEVIKTTESGLIYKLIQSPDTVAGKPKVLKIRVPDKTKPERGDADFVTDYPQFKSRYATKENFKLIEREKFEMIELTDKDFNVRVYFSSIPPSRIRGIK